MLRLFGKTYPIRKFILFFWEGIFLYITLFVLTSLTTGEIPSYHNPLPFLRVILVVITCLLSLYYFGLYSFRPGMDFLEMTRRLLQALGSASIFLGLVYWAIPPLLPGKWVYFWEILLFIALSSIWRYVYLLMIKRQIGARPTAILAQGGFPRQIVQETRDNPDCGYKIQGIIASPSESDAYSDLDLPSVERGFDDLLSKVHRLGAEEIIVAMDERRGNMPIDELIACKMQGIDITEGETFIEATQGKILVDKINPSWLIFKQGFQKSRATLLGKRLVGGLLSLVGLILTLPVTVLTALLIKLESEGPIFYRQVRVGKDGVPFEVIKFRSMTKDAEKDGAKWATQNDSRVTRVGRVIRKTRIDEIPQMWNVLKGEMSFVGPRPERPEFVKELKKQIRFYDQRHTVQPGLTGWAQINYPYGSSVEDAKRKLEYDLYYIKHMSIWLDLFIILKTVKTILFREGAR